MSTGSVQKTPHGIAIRIATPCDLTRMACRDFAHLLAMTERLAFPAFAERIAAHYDATNARTAAVIAALRSPA